MAEKVSQDRGAAMEAARERVKGHVLTYGGRRGVASKAALQRFAAGFNLAADGYDMASAPDMGPKQFVHYSAGFMAGTRWDFAARMVRTYPALDGVVFNGTGDYSPAAADMGPEICRLASAIRRDVFHYSDLAAKLDRAAPGFPARKAADAWRDAADLSAILTGGPAGPDGDGSGDAGETSESESTTGETGSGPALPGAFTRDSMRPQADHAQAAPGDGETGESESTTGETSRVELLPVGGRFPESVVFECGAAMAARLSRETRTIKVPVRAAFEVIRDHGTGWNVSRVVWDDGTESYAKWFYDTRTALYRLGAGAYGDSVFAQETAHGPAFDPDAAAGNNPDAGLRDGETPADAFRDWANHYLTPECFGEHRGITPDAARELIARGRREHESGAAG